MSGRTVAALATAPGNSALGVIRISGNEAIAVADRVFFPFSKTKLSEMSGYSAAYGEITDGKKVIDDGVALVFKAPHSFTGEDTVEISVHGGELIVREVLRLLYANGAFPAEPGEFSKRGFINGKFDLTKAESIMGLISAKSEAGLRLSRAAHLGGISGKVEKIVESLTKADAAISVFSDYPDEDIEGLDRESFAAMLSDVKSELSRMLSSYGAGKVLRDGIDTVIVGKPNVGKSTVMNMLSGVERSIVTSIAGTTRDVIEDTVTVGDVVLNLADTAGIHTTSDEIENIGVALAKKRLSAAQLILAVFDGSDYLDDNDRRLLDAIKGRNVIVLINKTDMQAKLDISDFKGFTAVKISAKEHTGYDDLKAAVARISGTGNLSPDDAVLINERQRFCAERALEGVSAALEALKEGNTLDAVGICVDDALSALFELTGKRVTNEVTDEIFKSFCVGK